ncbi:hypothetical protein PILCRDRAFT_820498 [Piloderma croceum F 1598]|uniref:Uncharacterized protein n=1 Tax=Piloderma croceum (strain F 1598) TaxID=765440 RepID=A0A0C3BZ45_PILCF|nr:hypothetical protein PILCRDRAFT_820498 [Piloderma croceum F 1598]
MVYVLFIVFSSITLRPTQMDGLLLYDPRKLSNDSLGTSLDRVLVNGLGHLTESSGGQDGTL